MKRMTNGLILCLCLWAAGSAADPVETSPVLTNPDIVFDLGLDARSVALGAAGDIFSESATAVFANPAALVGQKRTSLVATSRSQELAASDYTFDNSDSDLKAFAGSFNIRNGWGAIGVGALDFGVDGIPETEATGYTPTGETFSDKQTALVVSYAKPFDGDRIALGISYRYLRHELVDKTGDGRGFDIGLRYRFSESWYGGAVIRDGVDVTWPTHEELAGSAIKYSLAGRAWGGKQAPLWLMLSATQRTKQPIVASVGLEQRFEFKDSQLMRGVYYLRASLGNAFVEERNFGRHDGLNAGEYGFGFGVAKSGVIPDGDIVIDYAFRRGEIWNESYFTFGVRYGS